MCSVRCVEMTWRYSLYISPFSPVQCIVMADVPGSLNCVISVNSHRMQQLLLVPRQVTVPAAPTGRHEPSLA